MNAAKARQLRPGDEVVAPFSNSHRLAEILEINWPHFMVRTTLASGEVRTENRRYRSLWLVEDYKRTYGEFRS